MPSAWIRPLLLALAGVALMQASYMLALPPFRGADEFDHAFRAAGVADGQVRLDERVPNGRGELVYVPAELVRAASEQCEALPYTGYANCHAVREREDQRVAVATSAGSYNPAYYWVVGAASARFEGASALYAMRITSGLLCFALVAAGFTAMAISRRGPLVWLSALAGLTPMVLHSLMVVAPNGIEMAAGFAAWSALLSLFAGGVRLSRRNETLLIVVGTAACAVLVTVRTLGPLWLLVIAACVTIMVGRRPILDRLRARPWAYGSSTCVVAIAALGGLIWSVSSGLTSGSAPSSDVVSSHDPLTALRWPLWTLQAIAAVPLKDDPAPAATYVLVILVLIGTLAAALRRATTRVRGVVVLAGVLAAAVPTALVLVTLSTQGAVWQGRYILPFACGIPLLATWTGPSVRRHGDRMWGWTLAALSCLAAAHVLVAVTLQDLETHRLPSSADENWIHGPLGSTGGLMVAGWVLIGLALVLLRALQPAWSDQPVQDLPRGTGFRSVDV